MYVWRPSINTSTPPFPFRLMPPLLSTVTPGVRESTSSILLAELLIIASTLTVVLSMECSSNGFFDLTTTFPSSFAAAGCREILLMDVSPLISILMRRGNCPTASTDNIKEPCCLFSIRNWPLARVATVPINESLTFFKCTVAPASGSLRSFFTTPETDWENTSDELSNKAKQRSKILIIVVCVCKYCLRLTAREILVLYLGHSLPEARLRQLSEFVMTTGLSGRQTLVFISKTYPGVRES